MQAHTENTSVPEMTAHDFFTHVHDTLRRVHGGNRFALTSRVHEPCLLRPVNDDDRIAGYRIMLGSELYFNLAATLRRVASEGTRVLLVQNHKPIAVLEPAPEELIESINRSRAEGELLTVQGDLPMPMNPAGPIGPTVTRMSGAVR